MKTSKSVSVHVTGDTIGGAAGQSRRFGAGAAQRAPPSLPSVLPSCAVFYKPSDQESNSSAAASAHESAQRSPGAPADSSDKAALALASRWAWALAVAAGVQLTPNGPRLPRGAASQGIRATSAGPQRSPPPSSQAAAGANPAAGSPHDGDDDGAGAGLGAGDRVGDSRASSALRALSDPSGVSGGLVQRGGRSASVSPLRGHGGHGARGLPGLSAETAKRLSLRPALEELGWLKVTRAEAGGVDGSTACESPAPPVDWGPFDPAEVEGVPAPGGDEGMGPGPGHRPTESAPVGLALMARLAAGSNGSPLAGGDRAGGGTRSGLMGNLQALAERRQALDPDWLGADDEWEGMPGEDGDGDSDGS